MGITNNEVKFLVTLDIDQDKSKKKVDAFLAKTIKDQKLTFDVKVGDSNRNINNFLSKHKDKVLNLSFDVAVGKSQTNIKTFLRNQDQTKKSIIFYVNEQATKVTINSALKKIEVQPLLINLGVNHQVSKANINKFISEVKVSKKPIELILAKNASVENINKSLEKIIFAKAKVKLGLAKGAFNHISDLVAKKEFTGLSIVGELNTTATKLRIQEQINKMSLPKFKVDVIANVQPIVSSKTAQATIKPPTQKVEQEPSEKAYSGSKASVIKQIKEEYKQAGKVVETFNKTVAEGEEEFIKRLKKQGNQVDIVRDAQTKEILKVTATYKNSANEIQKTVFTPLIAKYNDLNAKTKEGTKEIRGFVAQVEKINNTESFGLKKSIDEFNKKLIEAKHNSTILAKEYDKFSKQANSATSKNELEKLNRELEKHQSEIRKRNQLEKAQMNLIGQREQLVANLTRIEKMYLRTVNKEQAENIKQLLKSNSLMTPINAKPNELFKLNMGDINKAQSEITKIRGQIKQLNADATEATKNSMGIINSLKIAMEKFPIWMVASTAFYGVLGTLREFGSIILDIDTKMTDLKKVMSDGTDFGKVFEDATHQAEQFGQTISSTLDAYSMFAKQGFKGEQLNELAQAGLVAGNVGDIDTGKASEYLTASILQWNKETSEALSIVDSWNELSNNYATTVENLAQGQAKAGATAKSLGMDFNELNAVVGVLNARTKQSGNEIGNFIKSTFPNLLSNKGQSILSDLGVDLEDSQGNLRNIMDIYKDVAKEYKTLSQAEQNQVTLGLGGKYHISRLQTLLDDLGSVDSMYDQMLDSANNSANSAMNENEVFMQSLQARINLARVEVEKLAIAIGDAVMTDAMVAGLQLFGTVLAGITGFVSKFGVLPATITAVVVALTLFSNRFGDMLDGIGKGRMSIANLTQAFKDLGKANVPQLVTLDAETGRLKDNTAETNKNANAKKGLAKASRLLSVGFGAVGLATIGAGFAIEKLISWYGDAKQAKEDLLAKQEQELKSYGDNAQAIDDLTASYVDLTTKGALSIEEQEELVKVQNELGALLPELVKGEDEYGNKILINSEQAKTRVGILKQELETQKLLNEEKAKAELEEQKDTARDTVEDANKDKEKGLKNAYNYVYQMELVSKNYKELRDELTKGINIEGDWFSGKTIKNIDDVQLAIERVKDTLARKDELNLTDGAIRDLENSQEGLQQIYLELLQAQKDISSGLNVFKTSFKSDMAEVIESANGLSKEGKEAFEDFAYSVINLSDSEEGLQSFNDAVTLAFASKDAGIINDFNALTQTISDVKNGTITDTKEIEKTMSRLKKAILDGLKASGVDVKSTEYKAMNDILGNLTVSTVRYNESVEEVMKAEGKSREEALALLESRGELTEATDEGTESMDAYLKKFKSFDSIGEKMLGVSDKLVSETNDLVNAYNYLSNVTDRTTDETANMEDAMKKLKTLYPHLVKNGELRIDSVIKENETNKILAESYKNLSDEKYDSEESQTYNSAIGTKNRIENLKIELLALDKVMEQYRKMDVDTNAKIMEKVNKGELSIQMAMPMMKEIYEYNSKVEELDGYINQLNGDVGKLSSSNKVLSETTKKTTKEQSELQKVTDKYSLSMDKLNTALAKVQAKQKKYPTYSKQYRDALQEENKLIQDQIKLNEQKSKDLQNVANNGGSATGLSGTPAGFGGKITSTYGSRSDNHTGIDIDGAKGDLLQANVNGKVLKAGNASEIGEHWSYGNLVIIEDEKKNKHYYAHMDNVNVVKGQQVTAGTNLGTIGNTGNVVKGAGGDGSHLHYQVKNSSGKNIDPTSYVNSARQGSTSTAKSSGNSTQSTVWNYFKSKGFSDSAVAGIMGNLQQESNFNSNAGKNAQGSAYGIAQWRGGRLSNLNSFAKNKGTSANDLNTQLEFMWEEMQKREKSSFISLQRELSATEHASNFNLLYERSGEKAGSKGHNNRLNYARDAYNKFAGSGSTGASTSYDSSGSDDSASALSQIEALKKENSALADAMQENYYKGIQSTLEQHQRNRDIEDIGIAKQEELQKNMLEYNKAYEDSVNKQYTAEQRKLKSYQDEYAYIQKMYNAGGLTLRQQDELIDRRYELQQQMLESQNQIKEYYNEIIGGKLAGFDKKQENYAKTLEYEETKIQALDNTSERYRKTLELMGKTRQSQLTVAKQELEYINKMLGKGNLTIEMYEELTQRADELKKELIEVNQALHQLNYELIQSVAIASDLEIDDIDFEISYSQSLRGLYDEGSGDYKAGLEFELGKLEEKLALIEKKGKDIQQAMKGKDLGKKELQELEEQLEDNVLAYMDVKNAIQDTQDAIKDFGKAIDDQIQEKREDLAEKLIDALKDAIEQAKEIQLDALDKLIKAEEERHDKAMKALDDELEAYTKIIDAKRREIDDADRDRTHGNKLDELNTEKQDIQSKINLLSNVNTYEGRKEKEELEKKLAEIEKEIAEEKYQYEKDLREQQLDDMLEDKTDNIEDLKDKEDEHSKNVLDSLNRQKEYWEKHYNDLLNDEAEFNRIRKAMAEGHYEEVEALYNEYIDKLTASLPDLEDTFDGTWKAVGTQIRENVIATLKDLLNEIDIVKKEIQELEDMKNNITGDYGGIGDMPDVDDTVENDGKGEMTEADMKVLLAKFMNEQIAGSLDPQKDAVRIKNIRDKANKLASEGREEGSKINSNQSLGSLFDSMSSDQLGQLGDYFQNNSDASGFLTQEYLDYIKNWGQTASSGKTLSHGDKQVMLAKYMKEYLMPATNDRAKREAISGTANKIAESGRKNLSLISAGVSYDQSFKRLTGKQQAELGRYMIDNSGVVSYPELKSIMTSYADQLMRNQSNDYVGLDTGGMTKAFGSTGGMDNKGGKLALLHQKEMVLNPVDTERMLRISSIMDTVMRTINNAIAIPTLPKIQSNNAPTTTDNSTVVHVNIERMNGTQSDIDNLAKQIQNRLLREKGKR